MKSKNLLAGMSLALVLGGTMLATGCTVDNVGSNIDLKQEVLDSTLDNLNSYLQDMKDTNKTNEENLNNDSDYVKDTLLNLLCNQFVTSVTEYSPMSRTEESKFYMMGLSEDDLTADDETSDSAKANISVFNVEESTTYKTTFEDNTIKFLIEEKYEDNEEGTNQIKRYYTEKSSPSITAPLVYNYEGYVDSDGVAQESKSWNSDGFYDIMAKVGDVTGVYTGLLSEISQYNYFIRTVNGNETTYLCVNLEDFAISTTATSDTPTYNYLKIVFVDGKLDMAEGCKYYSTMMASVTTIKYDFENVVIDFDKTGYTSTGDAE